MQGLHHILNFEIKLLISISLVALIYHLLAGIRHLLIDFTNYGHELSEARLSALLTFAMTLIISTFALMEVW